MIVREARSEADYDAVRGLMRAFIQWHYERHASDRHVIDSYFDPKQFADELARLPGEFAPPVGRLLVAEEDGRIAGCVALRDFGDGACEMKRMFVDPAFHGRGVGMLLGRAIVEEARSIGYTRMLLDTGPEQREAQGLYRKLGFREVGPYYELPVHLREWLVFMELALDGQPGPRARRAGEA
ncbi:MAG TPA: GNAT family N-acetyltransferase [Sphingomicrobium sp.]|nr:GNAT family N-acetyltransferase [Sphingomicrobium sp.]